MNILLFGAPGAGKGTQSEFLVELEHMHHISTGDLFRSAIKNATELGVEAKAYMDKGELVPDAIVIGMVEEELSNLKGKNFVLDGFPRTVPQAKALEFLTRNHDVKIDCAIFLEVDQEVLLKRLSGRRICKSCGSVFHVETRPPEPDNKCGKCGGLVIQRDDDKIEAIRTRLEVYEKATHPLKEFYKESDKLSEVNGEGDAKSVYSRIEALIKH